MVYWFLSIVFQNFPGNKVGDLGALFCVYLVYYKLLNFFVIKFVFSHSYGCDIVYWYIRLFLFTFCSCTNEVFALRDVKNVQLFTLHGAWRFAWYIYGKWPMPKQTYYENCYSLLDQINKNWFSLYKDKHETWK